ncbi:MAG: hypothetical protein Tsb0018_05720 [Opitutales bacterium]
MPSIQRLVASLTLKIKYPMKKYGKVLLSVFGSFIVSSALLAVSSDDLSGDELGAFGDMQIVRFVGWGDEDLNFENEVIPSNQTQVLFHEYGFGDQDAGSWDQDTWDALIGFLAGLNIADVNEAGVSELIQLYEATVTPSGTVRFWAIQETESLRANYAWIKLFMQLVRLRYSLVGVSEADWPSVLCVIQKLADEVNAALASD